MRIQSFPPIVDEKSRILIVGTMPGNQSLQTGQYYAQAKNHFWDIMFRILVENYDCFKLAQETELYSRKIDLLLENQIALWDALKFCDRKGNLDKSIRNEIKNDFDSFFVRNSNIHTIIFNGQKACKYFKESFGHILTEKNIKTKILNSTSSTNANNVFGILKEWKEEIKNAI